MIINSEIELSWIKKNKYINDFSKNRLLENYKVHNKLSSFRVCLMNIKRSSNYQIKYDFL